MKCNGLDDKASWVRQPPADDADVQRASEWAGRIIPSRRWIVPDWIPFGQCTSLYGKGGINKTDLVLQAMVASAIGLPFLGYQLTRRPALGLFCEDDTAEIVRRIDRKACHYGATLAGLTDLHFMSMVGCQDTELVTFDGPELRTTLRFAWLETQIEMRGIELLVLDTLPDFFGGNEIVRSFGGNEIVRSQVEGGYVHNGRNGHDHYAPAVFSRRPDRKPFSQTEYVRAMGRLFAGGRLQLDPFAKPSNGRRHLVIRATPS
jgi:RecA-family ATPase